MKAEEINHIIIQLKSHEIQIRDVPEEIKNNIDVVKAERELGLRKTCKKGFDIIRNLFFVEEQLFCKESDGEICSSNETNFESFEEYYAFLEGDIYTDSCYKYYDFDRNRSFIEKNKIDVANLQKNAAFTTQTIDDLELKISQKELDEYDLSEKTKKLCKIWIKKFNACDNYSELQKIVKAYKKSILSETVDISFFFFNYIFNDIDNKNKFHAVMEYMSSETNLEDKLIKSLCSIYAPDEVLRNYNPSGFTKSTNNKHKRDLKAHIDALKKGEIKFCKKAFFDEKTHFYCEETTCYCKEPLCRQDKIQRYFESFEEFIEYRKGDLKNCDLSKAINLKIDFSKYETDESTKLPPIDTQDLKITIKKGYRNQGFYVCKYWINSSGNLIKKEPKEPFESYYFFDFVYFLKGNLSGADLLFCDGLENLNASCGVDFTGARLTSKLCEKFNVKYESFILPKLETVSLKYTEESEKAYLMTNGTARGLTEYDTETNSKEISLFKPTYPYFNGISYITDLHLMHRLHNFGCKSKNDIIYVIQKIINNIVNESKRILLIGGDVSSAFFIFNLFIKLLKRTIDSKPLNIKVVFILGNHELWDLEFRGKSLNEIIEIYREAIEKNGMYLIQNELLYIDSSNQAQIISYEQLLHSEPRQLRAQLQSTRLIIFGGIGFSGYNEEFNANNGIYRFALDREEEIRETKKFEKLYNFLTPLLKNKNVIIFTHMPKEDWCEEGGYQSKFVYVSGHTHRNDFFDDGDYRIYSDNQIGYHNENQIGHHNENPHLKSFLIDCDYDCFDDYTDGIYKISASQYNDFYRGKNIRMTFTREADTLYMLKKNGYYCFIYQGKSGSLSILNGGALSKLDKDNVKYYYEHMDKVISYINTPLTKYTNILKQVSKQIQKIGGNGSIHGCIVDIDYYNHIFVNPQDLTITGYWASDIFNKVVYPNIPSLLKDKCPSLYTNYLKLLENDDKTSLTIMEKSEDIDTCPKEYLDTTMYIASRNIKKMQRLNLNILTTWYDNVTENYMLKKNTEREKSTGK